MKHERLTRQHNRRSRRRSSGNASERLRGSRSCWRIAAVGLGRCLSAASISLDQRLYLATRDNYLLPSEVVSPTTERRRHPRETVDSRALAQHTLEHWQSVQAAWLFILESARRTQ